MSGEGSYSTKLSGRYLDNFLRTHVWERWEDLYKNFMMLVCVAEEMTPELCNKLTAKDRQLNKIPAAKILDELTRENAFMRVVGNNTYKFHDLFRDFLIQMLAREDKLTQQYNKAGDYFMDKRDYFRAVHFYIHANNDDGVAGALYQMYDYNSPYAAVEDTLHTVRFSLSEAIVKKHPFLLEVQAWSAYVEGRASDFEQSLSKYYRLLPRIILKTPRSVITNVLLRCVDYREDFVNILKKLRLVPFKGSIKAFTPSITQGIPYFHRSCRDFSDISNDMVKNLTLGDKTIGLIIGAEYPVIKESIFAGLHYEKGNMHEAQEHAFAANANIRAGHSIEIRFCAMSILSAVLFANGQTASASKTFADIEKMIRQENAFHLNMNLRAVQFFTKLLNGDKTAAKEWLSLYGESTPNYLPLYKIPQHYTTARSYIVIGDYDTAIIFLKKILDFAERYHRPLDIIETKILLAITYWQKGRGGATIALNYLDEAITVAYKYQFTQQFFVEGAELTTMLHRIQKRSHQNKSTSDEFASADYIKKLYITALAGAKQSKGLTGGRVASSLSFTDKQKEVMHLLCKGHSRNEISKIMGIKPYSVKSHTILIYNKLNVANSVEAILKIKEMELLGK
jgi:LuxR family maltose regulon positive regulatory protein